jgi:hypothetical protein
MFPFMHFIHSLVTHLRSHANTDEAYLAESVDIVDLERRMRLLDQRGRNPQGGIALGLYTR